MRIIEKKNDPIRQHHVPRVYLRNFCNPKGEITIKDKHRNKVFTTGINAVCVEKDFYTLEKAKDPYCWERAYAGGIEPIMGNLFSRIISDSQNLVQSGTSMITPTEKVKLALVMVVQLLRGKRAREYGKEIYDELINKVDEPMKAVFGKLCDEQNALFEDIKRDDYFFKSVMMEVSLNKDRIATYTNLLCGRNFSVYRIQGSMEFVTSDNPVMLIDCLTANARPFTNGLISSSTIVYYPISPKLLIGAVPFEALSNKDCCIVDLDAQKEKKFILTMNQKQIEQCYQQAFACSFDAFN